MNRAILLAAAFWAVSAGIAWPMDQIYTSTSEKPYFGKIISMSSTVINFDGKGRRLRFRPTRSPASPSRTRPAVFSRPKPPYSGASIRKRSTP